MSFVRFMPSIGAFNLTDHWLNGRTSSRDAPAVVAAGRPGEAAADWRPAAAVAAEPREAAAERPARRRALWAAAPEWAWA